MERLDDGGGVKGIDEESLATISWRRMREEMEALQS